MKFFHLSDLHIGKQLHRYSMTEEQRDILDQIVALAKEEQPDAVIVAGASTTVRCRPQRRFPCGSFFNGAERA